MRTDIRKAMKKVDTKDWKKVSVELGPHSLEVSVPPSCVELSMKEVAVLADPQKGIEEAFLHPISSPTLEEIIQKKGKPQGEMTVAIAVSDITRPVPYKGERGVLPP